MSANPKPTKEQDLIERAAQVLPAGGFGNIPGDVVIERGKAGRIWDESGREYVDYLLGSGPMFVGHCHPEVMEVVQEQLAKGTTFFGSNAHGIELAEEICNAMACASKVRFVSSGSEADMYAMRVARAHRGRDKILKFEGGYHGMSDYSLMSLAPKRNINYPQALPDSAGISSAIQDAVLVAPFNDAEAAKRLIAEYADELGGVIVEPFQRLIAPKEGFLATLREETLKYGIPLIFDEVVTGFRFGYGGAQELYGITPDMCTLGKIIGGGFPLAAIAGNEELMAHFDRTKVGDEGFTFQIGTLSGNPIAAVAGLKTLEILRRPGAYEKVHATGQAIMDAIDQNFARVGIPAQALGHPTMFDVVFSGEKIENYRGVAAGDTVKSARFVKILRDRGVFKSINKIYISLAHTDADVALTVKAIEEAADVMAAE